MKLSYFKNTNIHKNYESFSRQRRSFSERNFQGALLLLGKEICQ